MRTNPRKIVATQREHTHKGQHGGKTRDKNGLPGGVAGGRRDIGSQAAPLPLGAEPGEQEQRLAGSGR